MLRYLFSGSFQDAVVYLLSALAVIFLTMPVHEAAHAFVATKLGDPTPRYEGRYSLNPLRHIDYFGALCIILFGFGWAKPVSVNPRYFEHPKRDMALTAFAGPLANLLVAFVVLFLTNLFGWFYSLWAKAFLFYVMLFLSYIARINISLAVFNLIPIPPLDGSRLLAAFLPDRIYYRIMRYERILFLAVLLLCYTGILGTPISIAGNYIYKLFNNITGFVFRYI